METILSGLLGIMVGGLGVGIYFFRKNANLYSQVLDKQTIIKLIKEHMATDVKPKPRRNYRRKNNQKTTVNKTVNKTTKK